MNKFINKHIFVIAFLVLGLFSCSDSTKVTTANLEGCWVEAYNQSNSSQVEYRGMFLESDSVASSISMPMTMLKNWEILLPDNILVLSGYEIKYGRRLDFSDSLKVVSLTSDSLELFSEARQSYFKYKKIERSNLEKFVGNSINPIDSLPLNPNYGELQQRTYSGVVENQSDNNLAPEMCDKLNLQLTLWNQTSIKDGVYRLRIGCQGADSVQGGKPNSDSLPIDSVGYSFGRFYTLTYLTDNKDDVVVNLMSFDNKSIMNFLIINRDSLELIKNDYTFTRDIDDRFLTLDGSFTMNEKLLIKN